MSFCIGVAYSSRCSTWVSAQDQCASAQVPNGVLRLQYSCRPSVDIFNWCLGHPSPTIHMVHTVTTLFIHQFIVSHKSRMFTITSWNCFKNFLTCKSSGVCISYKQNSRFTRIQCRGKSIVFLNDDITIEYLVEANRTNFI